jgi:hypothetical protein
MSLMDVVKNAKSDLICLSSLTHFKSYVFANIEIVFKLLNTERIGLNNFF